MKLLEYEAKQLLTRAGVRVPKSTVTKPGDPEFLPAVLKSQVHTGGRGKAGGIVVVHDADKYSEARDRILNLEIKGHKPQTILAEELIDIDRELYLSLLVDKVNAEVVLMAHNNGGVEVEDNDTGEFLRIALDGKNFDEAGQQLANYYDMPDQTFALQELIEKLYKLFCQQDMTLLEINPLILTKDGKLVAGDAKVDLDDAAAFRHKDEWQFEAEKANSNFVTLDENGTVATIANGAGLAMATVDAVADAGLAPANFLDIGGGANEASVLAAFQRLVQYPNVKVIIINIFAGITRCDEVAKAIISARNQIDNLPPLTIRLAGTNYEQAYELLAENDVKLQPSLNAAISTAKELVA